MLETLKLVEEAGEAGKRLDQEMIKGRPGTVQRNLSQLEGRSRSPKYVERLAGKSSDHDRKARTEAHIQWFAATAIEDPERSARVAALYAPLFNYAMNQQFRTALSFWEVQEEVNGLLSRMRTAFIDGNRIETRFLAVQIRQKADVMLRLVDTMPHYAKVG